MSSLLSHLSAVPHVVGEGALRDEPRDGCERDYLILTKFREYLTSRKIKSHISRVLDFAILEGN